MSYQPEYIQKLNLEQAREIKNIVSQVLGVSPEYPLKQLWLEKKEGWVAVPIAVNENFTDFASGLLRVAIDRSYHELLGVFLETEVNNQIIFSVPSNINAISEFNVEPPPGHKVLFAGAPDWVVLMAESDYYVTAGPVPTVERFLDHSVTQAFTEFRNFIEAWEFPEQFAQRLQPLKDVFWKAYRNTLDYQNAPVGSRIDLLQ